MPSFSRMPWCSSRVPFVSRALTVLPSILVIILWRTVYQLSGSGVSHVGVFTLIRPTSRFSLRGNCFPRTMRSAWRPAYRRAAGAFVRGQTFIAAGGHGALWRAVVAALVVFLPWLRRDKIAAFWFAVMVLAAIPAATVLPLSKNLGFVAVGAYGLIASFIAGLVTRPSCRSGCAYRIPAWTVCVLLMLAHVPGAIAEKNRNG